MERHIVEVSRQAKAMEGQIAETKRLADAASESARAAKETVNTMEATAGRELRAYVGGGPHFIVAFDKDTISGARIRLTNYGQTPANNVRARLDVIARPYEIGRDFALPEIRNGWTVSHVLFPNANISDDLKTVISQPAGAKFTVEEIRGIRDGTLVIYVFGEIKYDDIFKREQTTTFCCGVSASLAMLLALTAAHVGEDLKINFIIAPMNNEAT